MRICPFRFWTFSGSALFWLLASYPITAQIVPIVPDATLPINSRVTTVGNIRTIEGGTQAGPNLFHSFQEFSVPNGSTAHFNNNPDIQNIISRVTGRSISNIEGLIRANGANLFFINPNGITFGPNASLQIGGSFVASTASSLRFDHSTEFSATNPQAPPLLMISTPLGLQFGSNPKEITYRSTPGLQVPNGKTLALIGGNVSLEGGKLTAPGGRIELSSVGAGLVTLTEIPQQGYTFQYSGVQNFQDIQLSNGSLVDASGEGGGSIQVQGRNINLTGGAQIYSATTNAGKGGTLTVEAAESVNLSGNNTALYTDTSGTGVGGDLTITTKKLTVGSNAAIYTTSSAGRGGNLTVKADESVNLSGNNTALYTDTSGTGVGGDLTIKTRKLTVDSDALIYSQTTDAGTGGTLTVDDAESVNLSGNDTKLYTHTSGTGPAGNLTINTRKLTVDSGASIQTPSSGDGPAGNLVVKASDAVELIGTKADGSPSGLFGQVNTGKGGKLTIETGRLTIRDGARIDASTFGAASGGDVQVTATDVQLVGVAELPQSNGTRSSSGISAQAQNATGDAGNVTINTQQLRVEGGAKISTATFKKGNGGNLTITATDSIILSGTSPDAKPDPDDRNRSGIFVSAEKGASGKVGNLNINTRHLTVENGAKISADNLGSGQEGSLTLDVRQLTIQNGGLVRAGSFASGSGGMLTVKNAESVDVIGKRIIGSTPVYSTLSAVATASGKAGDLNITTRSLKVQDGAEVSVSSTGSGSSGNLTITANDLRLDRGSLTATTNAGEGAKISLQDLDLLLMQNGSQISARAFNNANGGNIDIDAAKGVVVAVPNQNNSIIANAFGGEGGKIDITTQGIFGIAEGKPTPPNTTNYIDASSQFNKPGRVTINTPDVDPSRSLFTLSTGVVDASVLVASGCAAFAEGGSSFTVTGRGGLPPSPDEPLSSDVVWSDTRIPKTRAQHSQNVTTTHVHDSHARAIVPATGWVFNGKGEVTLISSASGVTGLGSTPATCPKR